MLEFNDQAIEDGVYKEIETAHAALVPVVQAVHRDARHAASRADASFVTQLIATSEQVPQTRALRRAEAADALSAYAAPQDRTRLAGARTRQTI